MIVTRFAPSPTGYLHIGHAYAALIAASAGERFILRIEDIDQGRARSQFVDAIFEDLAWLGLHWGMPVRVQSEHFTEYREGLSRLRQAGLLYPCFCTRKDIAEEIARADEAPHGPLLGPDGPLYPGTCRGLSEDERESRIASGASYALRLNMQKALAYTTMPLLFRDHGREHIATPEIFGDVVLARKELPASYHLAVTMDDATQGVTLVTRGQDLFPATHVQRLLQELLGLPTPDYAHHRLIVDAEGKKFSKRDGAVTLRELREHGAMPEDIREMTGFVSG
jgi:glutamyl-Q tRNA(Asp) synthetase